MSDTQCLSLGMLAQVQQHIMEYIHVYTMCKRVQKGSLNQLQWHVIYTSIVMFFCCHIASSILMRLQQST